MKAVLAKSDPPSVGMKAKLMAQFIALGWWDMMSAEERFAFFDRGELMDSEFARSVLLPMIKRSNGRRTP